jgi:hypothetical protein
MSSGKVGRRTRELRVWNAAAAAAAGRAASTWKSELLDILSGLM